MHHIQNIVLTTLVAYCLPIDPAEFKTVFQSVKKTVIQGQREEIAWR